MHGLPPPSMQHPNLPPLPTLGAPHMIQMGGIGLTQAAASQMAANMAAIRMQHAMSQTGCVILVSNLDEEVSRPSISGFLTFSTKTPLLSTFYHTCTLFYMN